MNEKARDGLTHTDEHGRAGMVDVGGKPPMRRRALAEGRFCAAAATIDLVMQGDLPKGEALSVARVAGVMAGKKTGELIPLCHPLPVDYVNVSFERTSPGEITVTAEAGIVAKTGIEMEALTAVSVACLTLYDMTKAVDKGLRIEGVRLVEKTKEAL
ncbi:MAG: cyclic pyranopterin monophosphate synthase MoaC [Planctomycetota bacterium]